MFTLDEVRGIQLQRLISYITQRNKQQKKYFTNITSGIFDLVNGQNQLASQKSMQSYQTLNINHSQNQLESQTFQHQNSIDSIKQTQQQPQLNSKEEHNRQEINDHNQSIMVTKPINPSSSKLISKKNVKFASKSKLTPKSTKSIISKNILYRPPNPVSTAPINMKSIMLSLKNHTIDHLKQQFIYNQNKINVQRFLFLMKQCISYDKRREYQIMYQLIKLFQEIDIDCNKSIDWEQFLQYLACYGWTSNDSQRQSGFGTLTDNQVGQHGKKTNFVVQTWNQHHKHRKNVLSKIIEVQKLDMLCLVQSKNFNLSFLTTKGQKYTVSSQKKVSTESNQLDGTLAQINHQNNSIYQSKQRILNRQISSDDLSITQFSLNHIDQKKVLSIDYSEHQKLFGVLQTDRKVYFVEEGQIQKSWGKVQGTGSQIDIMYLPLHRKWLLKRIDQYLDIFASPKQKVDKQRITFKPHQSQALTAIKQLKQPFSLITAGIDGKIKIWSLAARQLLIQLKPIGEQQLLSVSPIKIKGVKGIDTLNIGIQSYFCSWTFTTQIMLWLPSASVSKPYIGKLHGHSGIVESCEFVKPQHCSKQLLVSIDNKKIIKIWSIQKMECIQSFLHQGNGCKIKCLNYKPVIIVYDKIMQFNRLKLSSLMMGADKQNSNNKRIEDESQMETKQNIQKKLVSQQNYSNQSSSKFLQIQFCNHNILILLLLSTELEVINLHSGRIQAILEPAYKDEQQFVHMSIKINRRAFIVSSLGYVYYIKLDDVSLIKRFQISLMVKQMPVNNKQFVSNFQKQKQRGVKMLDDNSLFKKKQSNFIYKGINFAPKFIYYHTLSKILVVIIQLDDTEASLLLTYDQSTGYEFQKMKQIQFQQTELTQFFFFSKIDVLLIASNAMLTIWDWTKINVVNKIDFNDNLPIADSSKQIFDQRNSSSIQSGQSFVKHISINETNSNNCFLILVLTKYDDLLLYELHPNDFFIKQCIIVQIPLKLKNSIKSFHLISSNNQEIDSLVLSKIGSKKSKKFIGNAREKQVKFNFTVDEQGNTKKSEGIADEADHGIIINNSSKVSQISNHNQLNISTTHQSNHTHGLSHSMTHSRNKGSQQNILINRNLGNKQNKMLYILTKQGSLVVYHFNDIVGLLKKQGYLGHGINEGKKSGDRSQNTHNNSHSQNMNYFSGDISKKYVAHKIRQTRKATIKVLSNQPHLIGPIQLQQNLLIQKQLINNSWTKYINELYVDLMFGVSQKNEIVFFKSTGEIVGQWNIKAINPKRWDITYQLLPKMVERLNKLQWILNIYNDTSKLSASKKISQASNNQIDGSQIYKVLFLANKYLQDNDLMQLRQYVKMSTVKLLNMSKKNLLYKKGYGNEQKTKDIVSLKKIDDLYDSSISKKKSVTISKQIIQHNIDQNKKNSPSINNIPQNVSNKINFNGQNLMNNRISPYPLSSFAVKKRNQSQKDGNGNFFQQKFSQKVEEQNRLKVHRKYIDKQIQKTLKHAKQLQLRSEEKNNLQHNQRNSAHSQQQSQKAILVKQLTNEKKQHAKLLLQNATQKLSLAHDSTSGSNKLMVSQSNHLMIEQQMQKKQIQKNIDFVRRIQNSIQKIQMEYSIGWGANFAQPSIQKQKKGILYNQDFKKGNKNHQDKQNQICDKSPQLNYQNKKQMKGINYRNKKNAQQQHKVNEYNNHAKKNNNTLNIQQTNDKRRISIVNNILPEFKSSVHFQNSQKDSRFDTKSIVKFNEPSALSIKQKGNKQVDIHSQVLPMSSVNVKKNVEFSTTNKVIIYQQNQSSRRQDKYGDSETIIFHKTKFQNTSNATVNSLKKKSTGRSFSAVGTLNQQANHINQPQPNNSPSRNHLRSASIHNSKQKEGLSKSKSLYGNQFTKQKQVALNNFRQGMRQFENFYKRFGNNWGKDETKNGKKIQIKIN